MHAPGVRGDDSSPGDGLGPAAAGASWARCEPLTCPHPMYPRTVG